MDFLFRLTFQLEPLWNELRLKEKVSRQFSVCKSPLHSLEPLLVQYTWKQLVDFKYCLACQRLVKYKGSTFPSLSLFSLFAPNVNQFICSIPGVTHFLYDAKNSIKNDSLFVDLCVFDNFLIVPYYYSQYYYGVLIQLLA